MTRIYYERPISELPKETKEGRTYFAICKDQSFTTVFWDTASWRMAQWENVTHWLEPSTLEPAPSGIVEGKELDELIDSKWKERFETDDKFISGRSSFFYEKGFCDAITYFQPSNPSQAAKEEEYTILAAQEYRPGVTDQQAAGNYAHDSEFLVGHIKTALFQGFLAGIRYEQSKIK